MSSVILSIIIKLEFCFVFTQYTIVKNTTNDIFVNKVMALESFQNLFQQEFPYLFIEFDSLKPKPPIEPTLEKVGQAKEPKSFYISGNNTVAEVTELFKINLGLKVAIIRKLGQNSVETSFTSQWTLNRQNKIGSEVYFEH